MPANDSVAVVSSFRAFVAHYTSRGCKYLEHIWPKAMTFDYYLLLSTARNAFNFISGNLT